MLLGARTAFHSPPRLVTGSAVAGGLRMNGALPKLPTVEMENWAQASPFFLVLREELFSE